MPHVDSMALGPFRMRLLLLSFLPTLALVAAEPQPPPPAFILSKGDVVTFLGAGEMVKQVESAQLESRLTLAAEGQEVRFRDLSWQADTVFRQQRPRNFGTTGELLKAIGTTVVLAHFGQSEAMDPEHSTTDFIAAYEAMLDREVTPHTDRLVLISPHPFTRVEALPHLPDLTRHNERVLRHAEAIRQLARRRGWLAVDLSQFDASGLTRDGLQMTPEGQKKWAEEVARQLLGEAALPLPQGWAAVQEEIQRKNLLWRRYWRPTNWAFLHGDRQHVPSSHDHRPGQPRWFPQEIEAILPRISEAEVQILTLQTKAL